MCEWSDLWLKEGGRMKGELIRLTVFKGKDEVFGSVVSVDI